MLNLTYWHFNITSGTPAHVMVTNQEVALINRIKFLVNVNHLEKYSFTLMLIIGPVFIFFSIFMFYVNWCYINMRLLNGN